VRRVFSCKFSVLRFGEEEAKRGGNTEGTEKREVGEKSGRVFTTEDTESTE